jgi:hypothetical protein
MEETALAPSGRMPPAVILVCAARSASCRSRPLCFLLSQYRLTLPEALRSNTFFTLGGSASVTRSGGEPAWLRRYSPRDASRRRFVAGEMHRHLRQQACVVNCIDARRSEINIGFRRFLRQPRTARLAVPDVQAGVARA